MDLGLTDEQRTLASTARQVLARRLDALVAKLPATVEEDAGAVAREAGHLGWLGLGLPESTGGAGDFVDLVVLHEELGRGLAPSVVTSLTLAARLLHHAGAGDPSLPQGSRLVVPALAPGAVVRDGRVTGELAAVADGACAQQLLVAALVESTGVRALVLVDAARAARTPLAPFADITVCRVDLDATAGEVVAADAETALHRLGVEADVLAAARAVGGARAVLARTVEHVTARHQFGRAIGTFQAVQHQLADITTAVDAAGLAVGKAASSIAHGADGVLESSLAALAARDAFQAATLVAHQLHGGMGFVLDSPLHLWSARAAADPTGLGSRRQLVDRTAEALGLWAEGFAVPVHHRTAPAS